MQIWLALIVQYGIPGALKIYGILSEHFKEGEKIPVEVLNSLQQVENDRHASFVKELSGPI